MKTNDIIFIDSFLYNIEIIKYNYTILEFPSSETG